MKEKFRENVLEGITGALAVYTLFANIMAALWIVPSAMFPFTGIVVVFIPALALSILKLRDREISIPSLYMVLAFIWYLLDIFVIQWTEELLVVGGIVDQILTVYLVGLIGIILLLQAFDYIPAEERAEVKL